METVLIMPIVLDKTACDNDINEAVKLKEYRDKLLDLGYTIKETRLIEYQGVVMAHYVMHKEI